MEKKVHAMTFYGEGLNCDFETEHALTLAGARAERIILDDIYTGKVSLLEADIIAFGGGFHKADDGGAGVMWADDFLRYVGKDLHEQIKRGGLMIGICNGFQALVKMGVLPGIGKDYTRRCMSVSYNDCGNFIDDWVTLYVNESSPCIWTKGIREIDLPIRHGEGRVIAAPGVTDNFFSQLVMQYKENPNGSVNDIAGICDSSGRIFGLMPHPECFWDITQHPYFARMREELVDQGKPIPVRAGDGVKIFENAVKYVQDNPRK